MSRSRAARRAETGRVGRKPPNTNPPPDSPATARAAVTADGPGTTSTAWPAPRAAATSSAPGSEMAGMPASVVRASVSPAASRARRPGRRSAALCSVKDTVGRRVPRCRRSRAATRVSSATTRSAPANASAPRGERSPRLPMGVPTTSRRPDTTLRLSASPAGGVDTGGRSRASAATPWPPAQPAA